MARTTSAARQRMRDDANADRLCANGCGHLSRLHRELDRADPIYQPLHFHCQESGCDCVRIVEW